MSPNGPMRCRQVSIPRQGPNSPTRNAARTTAITVARYAAQMVEATMRSTTASRYARSCVSHHDVDRGSRRRSAFRPPRTVEQYAFE